MKKAAVVTIYDKDCNYGNKLQNCAAVRVIESLGFKCDTLVTEPQYNKIKTVLYLVLNFILRKNVHQRAFCRRVFAFERFNRKFLNQAKYISYDAYDYFVLGSDQVWNPSWYAGEKKNFFFLDFARREQKVCFSPSFGLSEVPEEWAEYFSEKLKTFPALSVREKTGAEIIKKLTGLDAAVTLDPTLMLDEGDWSDIMKKCRIRKDKPYILKYFLGEQDNKTYDKIKCLAEKHGFDVYELNNHDFARLYRVAPDEFLDLVAHSELICTDSFHGTVFSIIFKKPFLLFERDGNGAGMNSRIHDLLNILELQHKLPSNMTDDMIFDNNYDKAFKLLNAEREKTISFLKKSMGL